MFKRYAKDTAGEIIGTISRFLERVEEAGELEEIGLETAMQLYEIKNLARNMYNDMQQLDKKELKK